VGGDALKCTAATKPLPLRAQQQQNPSPCIRELVAMVTGFGSQQSLL